MQRIAHALARAGGPASHLGAAGRRGEADKDCKDFASQAEAQAWFEAHGGSAAHNVANLDRNRNGIACEAYPYGREGGAGWAQRWANAAVPCLSGLVAGVGLATIRQRRRA